eukprot:COSAG05_NODE_2815_length_2610_cov_1.418957_4_plen_103_part_00
MNGAALITTNIWATPPAVRALLKKTEMVNAIISSEMAKVKNKNQTSRAFEVCSKRRAYSKPTPPAQIKICARTQIIVYADMQPSRSPPYSSRKATLSQGWHS